MPKKTHCCNGVVDTLLGYLLREQDVISEQGGIVKRTGCNKQTGWGEFSQVVEQTGCFKQAKTGKTTPKP